MDPVADYSSDSSYGDITYAVPLETYDFVYHLSRVTSLTLRTSFPSATTVMGKLGKEVYIP